MTKERISNYKEALKQLKELYSIDSNKGTQLEDIIERLEPKPPKIKLLGNHAPQQVCPVCGLSVFYKTFDYEIYNDMCFCGTVIDWEN